MAVGVNDSPPRAKLQSGAVIRLAGLSCGGRLSKFSQASSRSDRNSREHRAVPATLEDGDILHPAPWFSKYMSLKHRQPRSRVIVVRWRGMARDRFRHKVEMTQGKGA